MTFTNLKESLRQWKFTRARVLHLAIGFFAVAVYEFWARPIYRPYIYRNNLQDFHLADTIGNSLGTVATVFVFIGLIGQGKEQHVFLIKTITLAVIFFEIAHPLLGKSIDPWDIIATLVTGGLCWWLYRLLHPNASAVNK